MFGDLFRQRRFEALVRAHNDELWRLGYYLSRDPMVAEDLVQETFLRAWRAFDELREAATAKAWLYTILRREHARLYERQRPDTSDDETLFDRQEDPAPGPEDFGQIDELRTLIMELPTKYREPLVLQVIGGFSTEEIGAMTGQSANAVQVQVFRARQKLKEKLKNSSPREVRHGLS